MKIRKRLYEIIEVGKSDDKWSIAYDSFMMIVIIISIVPLAFKNENIFFVMIDKIAAFIFVVDYFFRWITFDYRNAKADIVVFFDIHLQ